MIDNKNILGKSLISAYVIIYKFYMNTIGQKAKSASIQAAVVLTLLISHDLYFLIRVFSGQTESRFYLIELFIAIGVLLFILITWFIKGSTRLRWLIDQDKIFSKQKRKRSALVTLFFVVSIVLFIWQQIIWLQ